MAILVVRPYLCRPLFSISSTLVHIYQIYYYFLEELKESINKLQYKKYTFNC